jgi:glyoxylase-like metal-dependent hydrolase (beta-lactamase superfamily II)
MSARELLKPTVARSHDDMSGRFLVGDDDAWFGGIVSALAACVLAPNASPWTLDGTNTWVVGELGGACVVIDPGPLGGGHDAAILAEVEERRSRVAAIVLTHGHIDHSEGADELARRLSVPVRSWSSRTLADSDRIDVGGAELRVLPTPGHSSDSVCFVLDDAILTGDTVLGRGTSLVAHPDGRLSEYLDSLQALSRMCTESGIRQLLPGHGPVIDDPQRVVDYYLRHRLERLEQVRAAVAGGAASAGEVVDLVYADVPPEVRPAAEATVMAQLAYLAESN